LAAILVPVFSAHFAVAAGIVAEEIVVAGVDAPTVAPIAGETGGEEATADGGALSAGPVAAGSIGADARVTDIPVDTDTRGAHS